MLIFSCINLSWLYFQLHHICLPFLWLIFSCRQPELQPSIYLLPQSLRTRKLSSVSYEKLSTKVDLIKANCHFTRRLNYARILNDERWKTNYIFHLAWRDDILPLEIVLSPLLNNNPFRVQIISSCFTND